MTSLEDLKNALKEVLDQRGVLNQIKARIRAEVFNALDEQNDPKPQPSNINLVVNELIREYLEFNRYRHSLAVFIPETGQPTLPPFERPFLSQQLGVPENQHSIPLLYNIIALLQKFRDDQEGVASPSSTYNPAESASASAAPAPSQERPQELPENPSLSDLPKPLSFTR